MQIVIDIPEGILNTIQADEMISREQLAVLQIHILNGTPLPKGHGRLIDADELKNYKYHDYVTRENVISVAQIDWAETVIEADKSEV